MFSEESYENALMSLFDNLGYETLYGPEIVRDYRVPFNEPQLRHSLAMVNPTKSDAAIDEAIRKVTSIDSGTLVQKNQKFMDYLQNGVEVTFEHKGELLHDIIYLVDYSNVNRNSFQAVNQWTFQEYSEKRADIIVFVNGLPLVLVELKSGGKG